MVDWQVTATSINCEAVGDEVTIIVGKDWNTSCTGFKRYGENISKDTAAMLKKKGKIQGKRFKCTGPLDCGAGRYRDKLISEEKPASDR